MSRSGKTSCCLKTPSVASIERRRVEETSLMKASVVGSDAAVNVVSSRSNSNAVDKSKMHSRFPKKLSVDLQFSDIHYTTRMWDIHEPLKYEKKEILHGVSGEFRAGELTAIMGPSGAGKSTLLNILAGYKTRGVTGEVLVNGKVRLSKGSCDKFQRMSCYIMQDDALRPMLSVREAMYFAAHLKFGLSVSRKAKQQHVTALLDLLGLLEHENTRTKALSGGQKKRLSIALELISNPPVLFLDEPTTGLDSSSCTHCVSLLKVLAQQGRTVVCTIHQPSALLFEMFDHLYALAEGQCVYQGTIQGLLPFLGDLGLHCPPYHNPADFLLEVTTGEYGADIEVMVATAAKKVNERRKLPRLEYAALESRRDSAEETSPSGSTDSLAYMSELEKHTEPASMLLQFILLYYRNLLCNVRNWKYFLIRLFAHLSVGFLFGYLYKDVGMWATTVLGNYVYLYGTVLFLVYTGKMAVTLSFPLEMSILKREHFNGWYSVPPHFFSVILVEIPIQILGAVAYTAVSYFFTGQPTEWSRVLPFFLVCVVVTLTAQSAGFFIGCLTPFKIAVFLSPVIAVLLSMFGFNIFYSHIPEYLLWMYHISYFRAAFHGLVVTVYGHNRTVLPCPELYCHYKFPEKFLDEMDIKNVDVVNNTTFIGCVGIGLHMCTILVLWYKLKRR